MNDDVYRAGRRRLVDWVKSELIGPSQFMHCESDDEQKTLKGINPVDRFPCGAIYPAFGGEGEETAIPDEDIDELDDRPPSEEGKEPERIRRYVPPSSIGLSFFISGSHCQFEAAFRASRYTYEDTRKVWMRGELEPAEMPAQAPESDQRQSQEIWGGRCATEIQWRAFLDGWIVTVSLWNTQPMDSSGYPSGHEFAKARAEKTLFETHIDITVFEGAVADYPRVDVSLLDEEEREIELQYRSRKVFAIGHGTGVGWGADEEGQVRQLWTDAMPTAEVPKTDTDPGNDRALDLEFLSTAFEKRSDVLHALTDFVQRYRDWRHAQEDESSALDEEDAPTVARIVERIEHVETRMLAGIQLLESDPEALLAFALANKAILEQFRRVDELKGNRKSEKPSTWRPFQLAFLLTTLESTAKDNSAWRDVVDLIWFPTGGGKTEAYLGLISFVILLRRLKYPATAHGTAALMRYTLRLLTKDQFLRAARLICSLELIRRERDDLGDDPISIGMWVGGDVCPNSYRGAQEEIVAAEKACREPSLIMDRCPWCGQVFHLAEGNFDSTGNHFNFRCTNTECAFGSQAEPLPCNVVDEHLYQHPPTLLLGTIDKFARMAWEGRVGNFFGKQGNRPPEIIIQDELHLIASALGSISGIYEAAIDSIIRLRGVYPKYIASTATIRSAENQVRKLYGRDVAVFPPPGLDCDDSFYSRTIPLEEAPGRLYVGYYAPQLNRQKCLAPLAAALLAAPVVLFHGDENQDLLLDAWWTNVVYHGSLKGLGNSHMVFGSDVRDRLVMIIKAYDEWLARAGDPTDAKADIDAPTDAGRKGAHPAVALLRKRELPIVEELTSHKTAPENAVTFNKLSVPMSENPDGEQHCLDAALATNMISVGLDVDRLALMVINGQPLTTAEYIQASSRVGRSAVPGIVFTNFYRDQARSMSHYEQFRAYHEAFYRYVEPSSVTPFTWQSRMKALHAALVSVMRHGTKQIAEASDYAAETPEARRALETLVKRCAEAECDTAVAIAEHVEQLSDAWEEEVARCAGVRGLKYSSKDDRACESLLYDSDDAIEGRWLTLQSMRNVEKTALIKEL